MKLVFIHGRSQEDKDPLLLRQKWVGALRQGLDAAGLELPIDEKDIVFPYYGDALRDVTSDSPESLATVRFPLLEHEGHFACEVLQECLDDIGITQEVIESQTTAADGVSDRVNSALSNEWVHRGLSLLDKYVPKASARSMESTAADVTQYLHNPEVQGYVDNGVAKAFSDCGGSDVVVVGHSLGSIVAYRVLSAAGLVNCPVKALITIGSPLGLRVVRETLEPIEHPPNVGYWFNAYDKRDIIALNPLDAGFFNVSPAIDNFGGVVNESDNHHKIRGYLSNGTVATRIVEALTSTS